MRRFLPYLAFAVVAPLAVAARVPSASPQRATAGSLTGPAGAKTLVVRGVTLVDGTGRPPLANGCVVSEGGRITDVGALGAVKMPAGARVLTAPKGSTLLPGFIDMHVHSTVQPGMMPYFLANGITSVRDLGCAETKLDQLLKYRDDVPAGKQVGPRMFLAGPPIDGFPRAASWFPGPGARTAEEAVAAVDRLADRGVDCIKLYRRLNTTVAKAAVDEAHRRGLPVTWDYQWNSRYMLNAILTGTDGLEHVYYSERSAPEEIQQLAEALGAYHTWFEPTLVAFRPPDETVTEDPDFSHLPPSLTKFWNKLFWPMETDNEFAAMKSFVRLARRQGARLLVGTDTPVKYSAPGYGFHREMELLAECGMTPAEILDAATRRSAECLRRERELGTLEPGKLADMVVVTGNPLKEIRAARNVRWVVQGGRVYDPVVLVRQAKAVAPPADTSLPPYLHGD